MVQLATPLELISGVVSRLRAAKDSPRSMHLEQTKLNYFRKDISAASISSGLFWFQISTRVSAPLQSSLCQSNLHRRSRQLCPDPSHQYSLLATCKSRSLIRSAVNWLSIGLFILSRVLLIRRLLS